MKTDIKRAFLIFGILMLCMIFGKVAFAADQTNHYTWGAPELREDNSILAPEDIAGYKLYYGTTTGQYTDSVSINEPAALSYDLVVPDGLSYYTVVTTIDTEGRESQYSLEVVLLAPPKSPTNVSGQILTTTVP